uniref:Uncharacterized protein n=1 Tax=Manihot esculenta TaxID=3983 RepID=A0A2C9UDJ5_MANES
MGFARCSNGPASTTYPASKNSVLFAKQMLLSTYVSPTFFFFS